MFSRFCFLLSDIASDFLISHQWQRQRQVKTAYLAHLIGPIFRLVLIWCKFCFLSLEIPCPEIWLAILGATYCSKCSSLRQTFLTSFPPSLYPNYTLRFNITFKPQNKKINLMVFWNLSWHFWMIPQTERNFNISFGFFLSPCFERSLKDAFWCFSLIMAIVDNQYNIYFRKPALHPNYVGS